ncbi:phage/plasmid replication protein, II/X family [Achromobacter xylosoxidans]|uniref:phage/plasmid replication protein, II/X family n=1 Tax=Achromobacter TaxID=222 RepID=UPI0009F17F93|nr:MULTISPECIES: phage/plasmid replication protein, II/X family [Achromobacter]PWY47927.1 hypothetical protein DK459_19230 [Achromobacter sp. RW408]
MKIDIPRATDVGIDTIALRTPYTGPNLPTSYQQLRTSDGEIIHGRSHSISLKGRDGAHTLKAWHNPTANELEIEGSPNGYVFGQNLYSGASIHAACKRMLRRMSRDARLADSIETTALETVSIDRVDLFMNLRFQNNKEAADVLQQLGLQFVAQQKSVFVYPTSAYWNPCSGRNYQVICYAKGLQLKAKQDRMRTRNEFFDRIVDEADGIVRIELRLRKPELEQLQLTALSGWNPGTPREVFRKYFERLPIFNVAWGPIRVEELGGLSLAERRFYSLYKHGVPLREHYTARTIRKHVSKFRTLGIDLNVPNAVAEALQLGDLLSSSERIATPPEWLLAEGRVPKLDVKRKNSRSKRSTPHKTRLTCNASDDLILQTILADLAR